ncbi:hypothetical protein [Novosphingobium sp. TH158]|uniref:hypothetical protein n=1 Tax=Novosphingobium sp. TH158 TaxID=2067455 RepID=UPI000C7D06F6|nr:hypothetical protein [Novosphingobium sp. TH158]PLK27497.1 hypothetical protein C0V78_11815 [Novosphingobium sp. TH158]
MSDCLDIRKHDALFASRMPEAEWNRIVAFRNLPRFLDGVRRHEGVMQPFFAYNLILNKVVAEVWRFQILVFTLYLHATRDPGDPRSGLTVANLQRVCRQLGLASPGRVSAFLNVMKLGGYLTPVRSKLDSRVVHLEPTGRFMAIVEEWNDNIFASVDAAAGSNLLEIRRDFPELGREMRIRGAQGLLAGWQPIDPFPEVLHFAASDGGWLLMEHVALASITGDAELRRSAVELSIRSAAGRFGGSRSNLLRLLASGHEQGLLDEPPGRTGQIRFSDLMICSFLTFMASFLGYFQMHAQAAIDAGPQGMIGG